MKPNDLAMQRNAVEDSHALSRRSFLQNTAVSLSLLTLNVHHASAQAASGSKIATLLDGGFSLPASTLTRGRNEAEVRTALLEEGLNPDKAETVLNVSFLKRGKDVILFDCGAGQNFMAGTGKLLPAMAEQGITPEDVKHVIFTHGHPDHLWGALDDFDTPAFPAAQYYFPALEWDYWFSEAIYSKLPEDRHSFAAGAQRILKALEPQIRRYKGGDELVSGVAALATPGHTPGHMSLEAKTDQGLVLIGGDALTHPVISFRYPEWAGGFDDDIAQAGKTRLSLLSKLVAEKAMLIGYHLPKGGMGRVEAKGAAYRFISA